MEIRTLYYQYILDLFVEEYQSELEQAQDGHCMKVVGLPINVLEQLLDKLKALNTRVQCSILSETLVGERYISATKLIELRNDQSAPVLVLIPVNNETSAEDSFGNATFRELSISHLNQRLYRILLTKADEKNNSVVYEVLEYLKDVLSPIQRLNYLLYLDDNDFSNEAIAHGIFHLGILPDADLYKNTANARRRIALNARCTDILSDFSKSITDRIALLPIKSESVKAKAVQFLQNERQISNVQDMCERIANDYPDLDFSKWEIEELTEDPNEIRIASVELSGKHLAETEDGKELKAEAGKNEKLKIRITTSPKPKDCPDLKSFAIALYNVDGMYQEVVVKTAKVTDNAKDYRDVNIELQADNFNAGRYFFRVSALNEVGNILNEKSDIFCDTEVHDKWLSKHKEDPDLTQDDFAGDNQWYRSCDSESFYLESISIEDGGDEFTNEKKKDKLNTVLEAYFHYRIERIRKKDTPELSFPMRKARKDKDGAVKGQWEHATYQDTFLISYSQDENYQIPIPKKLLEIERTFIKYGDKLGSVDADLLANHTAKEFKSIRFREFDGEEVPESLLVKRKALFELIAQSTDTENGPQDDQNKGVIETFDIFAHIGEIKDYLVEYNEWIKSILNDNPDADLLLQMQRLDMLHLNTELPEGNYQIESYVIPPLHPLRLAWFVNLYEQYEEWENRTLEDASFKKSWYKQLDKIFYGGMSPDVAPLVLCADNSNTFFQYVGELTYGWGIFADPNFQNDDTFSSGFRQAKSYIEKLLNIAVARRVDSDVNVGMVYHQLKNYISQHPYTDKLIINLFNAGDASVFAQNLVILEHFYPEKKYELRLFCNDKQFAPGEALQYLINPENQVSEEAEVFSQSSDNRLFPKLRFSINTLDEFRSDSDKFPAHISFLINPFPAKASLQRPSLKQQSFFLNGIVDRPVVCVDTMDNGCIWHRYFSNVQMPRPASTYANEAVDLYATMQSMVASTMSNNREQSVPALQLDVRDSNAVILRLVHDVSDWVVTFDKNMGPEYYDMPCKEGEVPYLLDYIPSSELNGISSFLSCRPTSEIEGLMKPHFKTFGINVSDHTSFYELLGDVRSVSSSIIMQLGSSQNKAFEVLGTTLMKRMLERKELLTDSFVIPIDLHKDLFKDLPSESGERADNLLVDIHVPTREIVFTIVEIKCRQHQTDEQRSELQEKMKRQISNTIVALHTRFDTTYSAPDRLDRELMSIELQSLLLFYVKRARRFNSLCQETADSYEQFILSLTDNDYTIRFKRLGLIYEFNNPQLQLKEDIDETTFYTLGQPMIERILEKDAQIKTINLRDSGSNDLYTQADTELKTFFEMSDRTIRETANTASGNEIEQPLTSHSTTDVITPTSQKSVPMMETERPKETEAMSVSEGSTPYTANSHTLITDTIVTTKTNAVVEPKVEPIATSVSDVQPVSDTNDTLVFPPALPAPDYSIMVGTSSGSKQFGILGKALNGNRTIAIDLSETNTISLFGVQGGGKSYTIGTITEMTLGQFPNINTLPAPMASVIFHYSESMDYAPEFASMIYPNDKAAELKKLKEVYGAEPGNIEDVIMLVPEDKVEQRKAEYPSIEVRPIKFHSTDLNVQDWMFLLKAVGNDSTYISQLRMIMRQNRNNLNLADLRQSVADSSTLSASQKNLALQRLDFAGEYIDDSLKLGTLLKPGRLIVVDLRDEFIEKDDALGLFVIMLNIFSSVREYKGHGFNKFIVFDEAHKYMGNRDLTSTIVTAIREMRHKGVSMMIASQDPMSLPNEIIELSSIMLMHKFNSPQWVRHVQRSIIQLQTLSSSDMASLQPGEAYLWATKATDKTVTLRPIKISTRPRVTKHGGDTIKAI